MDDVCCSSGMCECQIPLKLSIFLASSRGLLIFSLHRIVLQLQAEDTVSLRSQSQLSFVFTMQAVLQMSAGVL